MALADNMPRDAIGDLKRDIRDLERAVREMRAERRLDSATISAEPGKGIRVADFNGTDFAHPGTTGNYFGGDGMVINQAYFRGGIVGNDALTNPVVPGSVWQQASGFTVSPAWNTVINYNLTVPAGVTSAAIDARARVTAYYNNPGTGTGVDYLYGVLYVGSADSDYYPLAVTDNGGSGTNQVFRSVILTGLTPGDSVNFQYQVSSDFATWTAPTSPGNKAKLGASVQWYR